MDIFVHHSKFVYGLAADIEFDYVVTLCGNAKERCPSFSTKNKVSYVGFDDPLTLT